MKLLAIETSCDETALCLLEQTITPEGEEVVTILGNALFSQIDIHEKYGGVFPALAKRAHAEHCIPLLVSCLTQAGMLIPRTTPFPHTESYTTRIAALTEKESDILSHLIPFLEQYEAPDIDAIAVTTGPGLAPALWVGVTLATTLAAVWKPTPLPLIPVNHMEGHLITPLYKKDTHSDTTLRYRRIPYNFPALALLVSGGHTELVHSTAPSVYKKIGQTRDDAIGEAFDKVARMIGLSYPGGPKISAYAQTLRTTGIPPTITFPQPMRHSGDYDFSFSGIKTAVRYFIATLTEQGARPLTEEERHAIAYAFEEAAISVLVHKTVKACAELSIETIIVGGGVAGNTFLRQLLTETLSTRMPHCTLLFPEPWLATDNAIMIGLAAFQQYANPSYVPPPLASITACGNLSL